MLGKKDGFLKVSSGSNPNSVAGAIASAVKRYGRVEVRGIGGGALNQGLKAVARARGMVAPEGIDLICIPAFTMVDVDGKERNAMTLFVEPR